MTVRLLPWVVLAVSLAGLAVVLRRPLGALARLTARSLAGLGGIWLFNQLGVFLGVQVGFNLLTALTVGLLGVPGLGFLLLFQCV